ncbi:MULTISPECIES: cation:proton antiporter [unclassified Pseudoalteromonas]|uniref:cation:proton antiporter n=1 Tax=unclassified Pseudoalteromonas TaxID=194690 RepID=UPI002096F852|nr:cation:proton antiporter [Pseudoalteromonas sp. XMcav2-N]MCO7188689.1 cation:proton antiporter [Pseudoalteromonas sp. XMcav2-N]
MEKIYLVLAWMGLAIFLYSIAIRQLKRAEFTGPMWFVLFGCALGWYFQESLSLRLENLREFLPLVELILAIFLFSDAAKTRLRVLLHSYQLPLLLLLALPLTMGLAALGAHWLLSLPWLPGLILAIMLTPTDAALCQSFIQDKQVPAKLREAINVESGLNDGLCVPVFLFLLSSSIHTQAPSGHSLLMLFLQEVGIALAVALMLTIAAIWLIKLTYRHHFFAAKSSPFLFIGIAIGVFSLTQLLEGSGFIAVFISGLLFDYGFRDAFKDKLIEESEQIAELAAYILWVIFGISASVLLFTAFEWQIWLYALLAVVVFRFIPVMVLLMPTRLDWRAQVTLAWFGPKGLASVVLSLMLLGSNLAYSLLLTKITAATVLLSIFIFGVSGHLAGSFLTKKQQ